MFKNTNSQKNIIQHVYTTISWQTSGGTVIIFEESKTILVFVAYTF